MNTKLLSNRMFSKNIEEKFLSKYGNAKGDIKRIAGSKIIKAHQSAQRISCPK